MKNKNGYRIVEMCFMTVEIIFVSSPTSVVSFVPQIFKSF